jgi:steroid delta-isomerase-like uncharacterized protein
VLASAHQNGQSVRVIGPGRKVVSAMPSSNIDTARTYLEAAYRGDLDTTRQLIADGYVFVDYAKENVADTPEALRQAFQDDLGAWSDRQLEIENMMETTDGRVITQMRITATHTGTYKSVPATGRRVANTACNILRFDAQGRVVVEEAYHDDLTIMVQLGAVQRPGCD